MHHTVLQFRNIIYVVSSTRLLFSLPDAYVMIWIMGIREADVINTSYISNLCDLMDSGTIH